MSYFEIHAADGEVHAAAVDRKAAEERAQNLRRRYDRDFNIVEVPDGPAGWRYEVFVQGKWYDNTVTFATAEEAQQAADIKMWNWTMCDETRVVPSAKPVNYRIEDGAVVHIPGRP